ncbi:hypothetical protein AOQ84DRAFT_429159 [Glonium stellatum]|uniref:RRM domain-containing protein n=1 Tax=Glonium stellatum TaxID=574774 RepID=A0A8E2FCH7_9PEZI|nr:hypothetical protein AOQ84DRAFT_429159 [Glonium stellatum]
MDQSLDESMSARQAASRGGYRGRGQRGQRDRRQNNYPRDGVKKWVHDRYQDDGDARRTARDSYKPPRHNRYSPEPDSQNPPTGFKVRIDNLHFQINKEELAELFAKQGPVLATDIVYDRHDRSTGVAYVTYGKLAHAEEAIRAYHGQKALGEHIYLSMVRPGNPRPARNPFDNVAPPSRSLFERIEGRGGRQERNGVRRNRSDSPVRHSDVSKPAPEGIDRYVPGQNAGHRQRSPPPRRGNPRASGPAGNNGRRPGIRRPGNNGRGRDDRSRPLVQGRPQKTTEELDAEMEDYWTTYKNEGNTTSANGETAAEAPVNTSANGNDAANEDDFDIDMTL